MATTLHAERKARALRNAQSAKERLEAAIGDLTEAITDLTKTNLEAHKGSLLHFRNELSDALYGDGEGTNSGLVDVERWW